MSFLYNARKQKLITRYKSINIVCPYFHTSRKSYVKLRNVAFWPLMAEDIILPLSYDNGIQSARMF